MPGCVEIIVGGIGAFGFRAAVRLVAAIGLWRLSAFRMDSLDSCYAAEYPGTGMSCRGEQKPGNRVRLGRILPRGWLPGHFASIGMLPGWARVVASDILSAGVQQLCFWSFKGPGKLLIGPRLADINLRAGCMRLQNNVFRCGRGKLFRDIRARGSAGLSTEKAAVRARIPLVRSSCAQFSTTPREIRPGSGNRKTNLSGSGPTRPVLLVNRPVEETQIAVLAPEGPQEHQGQENGLEHSLGSRITYLAAVTMGTKNRHENTPYPRRNG
jgi:hypothetical protein